MTHSILIVGFKRDIGFLEYALRSIRRYVSGYHEVVLAVPLQEEEDFRSFPHRFEDIKLRMHYFYERRDGNRGFLHHMLMKCCADLICPEATIITHLDCDSLFCKPLFLPEGIMYEDRIVILCAKYENLRKKQIPSLVWQEGTERALGTEVPYEFMMAFPASYFASTYKMLRSLVESKHGTNFADWALDQRAEFPHGFSEHNCLGATGWVAQRSYYEFAEIHADPEGKPDVDWSIRGKCDGLVRQLWSRGGIDGRLADPQRGDTTKTYRQVCEDILRGDPTGTEGVQPLPTLT